MFDFGIWTIMPPIVTIFLAVFTRQVILSLLAGVVAGFLVLSNFQIGNGLGSSVQGMVDVFKSEGAVKTILFGLMVGGVIHLARITGGMEGLVRLLTDKARIVKGPVSSQLLGSAIAGLIFIESNLALLTAGTVTGGLSSKYRVSREQMGYVIQNTGLSVWSSVLFNGWGAAMMGVIAVQAGKGFISGEPFSILAHAIVYNFFAWITFAFVLLSIFTRFSFPAMRRANVRAAQGIELREGAIPLVTELDPVQQGRAPCTSNLLLPLLAMIVSVPVGLYITGDGSISKGSGSTAVLWAVLVGQVVGALHYILIKRVLSVDQYFRELLIGYQSMVPLGVVMTLAFLIGNVCGELNVGGYLSEHINGYVPVSLSAAFVFIVAGVISLSTGTSWGTFSIMIPIGIQIAAASGADPYLIIGAAISGSIFGDTVSPISDTGIVTSMATRNDHMDHMKTQLPYCLVAGLVALLLYIAVGVTQTN